MMKNRLTIVALFALFAVPVVIAVLLNSKWVDWQAAPDRAHGTLIEPVRPLGSFEFEDAAGTARELEDLKGRWWLALIQPQGCGPECMQRLELLRQIRLAQDRHIPEVGLLFATGGSLSTERVQRIRELDPTWLIFDEQAGAQFVQRFPASEPGAFYIVDPDGNIMERFELAADPTGIRKDLDRLLTWTVRE